MRAIKVTYRAVFQQPIGKLNPMGLKVPADFPVEIYPAPSGHFNLYSLAGAKRRAYGVSFASFAHAKEEMGQFFERQVQDWQIWGIVPVSRTSGVVTEERMLSPDEIVIDSHGKAFFKGPEDYTHILHAPTIPPGAHVPPAACGAQVNAKCFINNRANVEPSCKACAEVWKKEYRNK